MDPVSVDADGVMQLADGAETQRVPESKAAKLENFDEILSHATTTMFTMDDLQEVQQDTATIVHALVIVQLCIWQIWMFSRAFYMADYALLGSMFRAETLMVYAFDVAYIFAAIEWLLYRMPIWPYPDRYFKLNRFVQYGAFFWCTSFFLAFLPVKLGDFNPSLMAMLLEPTVQALVITGFAITYLLVTNIKSRVYVDVVTARPAESIPKLVVLMFVQPAVIIGSNTIASQYVRATPYVFADPSTPMHVIVGAMFVCIACWLSYWIVTYAYRWLRNRTRVDFG